MLGFGLSIEPQIWALIFTMVRVGAAFMVAPLFGAVGVPLNVRLLLTAAVSILSMHAAPIAIPGEIFVVQTVLAVAAEALVGLALGFVLQIAFAAPLVASEAIGMSMSLSFATAINPQTGQATPALGQFLTVLLTLLFLALDGHLVLVELVVKSYEVLPPGQAWLVPGKMMNIALFGGYAFLAGLLLALPVGFLLLCLNIVVGMLSRTAPALNLFAVGIPASLMMGVIALLVGMPAMGDYMQVIVREGLEAAQMLVLGGGAS